MLDEWDQQIATPQDPGAGLEHEFSVADADPHDHDDTFQKIQM